LTTVSPGTGRPPDNVEASSSDRPCINCEVLETRIAGLEHNVRELAEISGNSIAHLTVAAAAPGPSTLVVLGGAAVVVLGTLWLLGVFEGEEEPAGSSPDQRAPRSLGSTSGFVGKLADRAVGKLLDRAISRFI
jgi:hypothetical protein